MTQTLEMLQQSYGNEAESQVRCFQWNLWFEKGRSQGKLMSLMHDAINFLDVSEGYAYEAFQDHFLFQETYKPESRGTLLTFADLLEHHQSQLYRKRNAIKCWSFKAPNGILIKVTWA